jgi:hypothetical protein
MAVTTVKTGKDITAEALDKALGKATTGITGTAMSGAFGASVDNLAKLMPLLPENVQESIKKLPETARLEIAEQYFKLLHPEGLVADFENALKAELPAMVQKLADKFMVSVLGKRVQVTFPDGTDAEATAVASLVDPNAKPDKKRKGGFGSEGGWGESTATEKGKTVAYGSPSAMAKHYNLRITGHSDMPEVFTKPMDADGGDSKWKFAITSQERGKGIHVTASK